MTMPTTPIRAFHARLRLEHAEIDAALERLIEAFATGDQEVARLALRDFDKRLSSHLQMEDEQLLPAYGGSDPVEAARIAEDHRAIRAKLDELTIGSDLHATRLPAIRQLAAMLHAHAQREDGLLYRWVDWTFADQEIPAPAADPSRPSAPSR